MQLTTLEQSWRPFIQETTDSLDHVCLHQVGHQRTIPQQAAKPGTINLRVRIPTARQAGAQERRTYLPRDHTQRCFLATVIPVHEQVYDRFDCLLVKHLQPH